MKRFILQAVIQACAGVSDKLSNTDTMIRSRDGSSLIWGGGVYVKFEEIKGGGGAQSGPVNLDH